MRASFVLLQCYLSVIMNDVLAFDCGKVARTWDKRICFCTSMSLHPLAICPRKYMRVFVLRMTAMHICKAQCQP